MKKPTLADEVQIERQKLIQEMAPVLMHEMQSHLVNARNAAELIKYNIESASNLHPTKLSIYCDDILRSLQSCVGTLDAFVNLNTDVARSRNRKPVSMDEVGTLLRQCLQMFRASSVEFELRIAAEPKTTFALDRRFFEHVVLNIVQNAAKFAKKGTRVHVSSKLTNGCLNTLVKNVVDSKATADAHLWMDAGYARNPSGAGHGLTIAKQITNEMGGELNLSFEPHRDKGLSTVELHFKVPVT